MNQRTISKTVFSFFIKSTLSLFSILLVLACHEFKKKSAVHSGVLPNGLTWIVQENNKPQNHASLRLVVKAGSVHEAEDQQGVAHFLEHLAFNGSKHFPDNEIIEMMESIGAGFGKHLNAYTAYDHTLYQLDIPLEDSENIEKALLILRDFADGLLITPAGVDMERGIILQEERDRKNADSKWFEMLSQKLYSDSVYENRLPIGKREIIKTVQPDRIRDFYENFYQPHRMAVIATGNFESKAMIQKIKKSFTSIEKKLPAETSLKEWKRQEEQFLTIPDKTHSDFLVFTDEEMDSCNLMIINRIPYEPISFIPNLKKELKILLASSLINIHLDNTFKTAKGEAQGILSSFTTMANWARMKDFHLVGFNLNNEKVDSAYLDAYKTLMEYRRNKASDNDILQAKTALKQRLKEQAEASSSLEHKVVAAKLKQNFLTNTEAVDPNRLYRKSLQIIDRLSKEELHSCIEEILNLENRVLILSAPRSLVKKLPDEKEFERQFKKIEMEFSDQVSTQMEDLSTEVSKKTSPSPKDQKGNSLKQLTFTPSPENSKKASITQIENLKWLGSQKWTLSNGATLYLRPSKLNKKRFFLTAWSAGGTSLAKTEDFPSAELADDLFYNSGIANLDRNEKNHWLNREGIQLSLSIDEMEESIQATTANNKIEKLFQLVSAIFTQINPTSEDFLLTHTHYLNYAKNRDKNPQTWFGNQLNELLRQKKDRNPEMAASLAQKAEEEFTARFLKERFSDASDFVFIATGDFTIKQMKKIALTYLATLPTSLRNEKEHFNNTFNRYPAKTASYTYLRNQEPQSQIYRIYHSAQAWNEPLNEALKAAADILTRLLEREIREKEGGTYSISAFSRLRREPYEELMGGIVFSCDPQRLQTLLTKTEKVIETFLKGEFEPQLLSNYQKNAIFTLNEQKQQNSFYTSLLLQYERGFLTKEQYEEKESVINRISIEDCLSAAALLFQKSPYTQAILLPSQLK